MIRENIYDALYSLLGTVPGIVTREERLRHWNDVGPEECPYLCVAMGNEKHVRDKSGLRDRIWITPKLYIYVKTTGLLVPRKVINPILDQLQIIFDPSDATLGKQTLGGLVEHVRIDGEILTFEGTLGDTEVATVPLQILTTQ